MKTCNNCGQQFDDEMNFCPKCGIPLTAEPMEYFCPSCGRSLGETFDSFCPYCGQSFVETQNNDENDRESKGCLYYIVLAVVFFLGGCLLLVGISTGFNFDQSETTEISKNDRPAETRTVETKVSKSIPNDFVPVNVLNQVMYVPKEFKKMEVPKQYSDAGMALVGNVWKKGDESKGLKPDFYDIHVLFEKAKELKEIKPHEEEQVLELIFKNAWNSMQQTAKVVTKREFISKEICKNLDGHKYLKVISIVGNPNKPDRDMKEKMAIYIFDDTAYIVSVAERIRSNGQYAEEIDNILDTFGVRR